MSGIDTSTITSSARSTWNRATDAIGARTEDGGLDLGKALRTVGLGAGAGAALGGVSLLTKVGIPFLGKAATVAGIGGMALKGGIVGAGLVAAPFAYDAIKDNPGAKAAAIGAGIGGLAGAILPLVPTTLGAAAGAGVGWLVHRARSTEGPEQVEHDGYRSMDGFVPVGRIPNVIVPGAGSGGDGDDSTRLRLVPVSLSNPAILDAIVRDQLPDAATLGDEAPHEQSSAQGAPPAAGSTSQAGSAAPAAPSTPVSAATVEGGGAAIGSMRARSAQKVRSAQSWVTLAPRRTETARTAAPTRTTDAQRTLPLRPGTAPGTQGAPQGVAGAAAAGSSFPFMGTQSLLPLLLLSARLDAQNKAAQGLAPGTTPEAPTLTAAPTVAQPPLPPAGLQGGVDGLAASLLMPAGQPA